MDKTYCVEGWPAILKQADGDDRSEVDRSGEPAHVYEGDDLAEALRAAREWLDAEPVEVHRGRGLARVSYAVADVERWTWDGGGWADAGGVETLDNLPPALAAAWARALKGYRAWLDYDADGWDDLPEEVEP